MIKKRTDLRRALDLTMREFGITHCYLSETSGVSGSSLSRYLSGTTDLSSSRLQKVIDALPSEARSFFFVTLNPTGQATDEVSASSHENTIVMVKSYLFNCSQSEWMELLGEVIQARRMTLPEDDAKLPEDIKV